MNKKYLIVNADDFGMNEMQNDAIIHLFNKGRITSSTLLAPGHFAKEAMEAARQQGYPVGVHWTLNSEFEKEPWKALGGSDFSFLKGGYLPFDQNLIKKARPKEVTQELEAQYQTLVDNGITPTHGDSHCGTLYGLNGRLFFINAFKACRKHNLPFRFPKNRAFLEGYFKNGTPKAVVLAHKAIILLAKIMGVRLLDDLMTSSKAFEENSTYEELKKDYIAMIKGVTPGITELFLHPAREDKAFIKAHPQWQKRVWEYEFLLSDDFVQTIKEENIQLVSYKQAFFR